MKALECSLSGFSAIDTRDLDAVQALLDSCVTILLDPTLWLWVIAITIGCALVGAAIGWSKGRMLAGLVWSLVLGPIGWIVMALSKSKLPECPACGRPNSDRAKVCRHCGVEFRKFAQRTARSGLKAENSSGGW